MRKIVTLSLAAVALIGAGGVAYAQADRGHDRAPPETRAQVEARSAEAFARMDANDDGVLNQADREARRQEMQQQRFDRLDANDDGELNPADREARQKQAFDRIDADHSGGISFTEFTALREQRGEARAERAPGREGSRFGTRGRRGGPDGPGRRGRPDGPGGPGMARAADTDRDGTVTQAEFASAALARFDRIDANKDGTIGADERPAPRRMMRRMRRAPDAG